MMIKSLSDQVFSFSQKTISKQGPIRRLWYLVEVIRGNTAKAVFFHPWNGEILSGFLVPVDMVFCCWWWLYFAFFL